MPPARAVLPRSHAPIPLTPAPCTQGLSESRVASHNSHFGARTLNKKDFSIFPFKFISMGTIAQKHGVDFAKDA